MAENIFSDGCGMSVPSAAVSESEAAERNFACQRGRLVALMREQGVDACVVSTLVGHYYLTGRMACGYLYITADGRWYRFLRRVTDDVTDHDHAIRKPEQITELLGELGEAAASTLALEVDELTHGEYLRLERSLAPARVVNATALLRSLRSVKSEWEIGQMRLSARRQAEVYAMIPSCYRAGMSDLELQAEIELRMRLNGSIGCFRAFGAGMEMHMGIVLAGDNGAVPSPYDFALGGGGIHPAMPLGACGATLERGSAVLVDMAGNYTAYLSDMTRMFSVGRLPQAAYDAYSLACDIEAAMVDRAREGVSCADLFNMAYGMAERAGMAGCFMGSRSRAKFVGHGLGLQINEAPVLTPRSGEHLVEGMTFAFEPKFVLEGVGAVGVENTFVVRRDGVEKLTVADEGIVELG